MLNIPFSCFIKKKGCWVTYSVLNNPTLYASPYLVATPQGYTKHYYAETERITSQIGKGQLSGVGSPVVSDSLVQVKLQAVTANIEHPEGLTVPTNPRFAYLDTLTNRQDSNYAAYWYHPDLLGSSSWITYTDGSAVQHLYYLPWGEDFVDQRTTSWNAPFTFSAKEKDSETGLSYFGARYYSSDLSIWLSVDPMSDKYPSLSPYVYCADNPIKLVDPNGEEIVLFVNKTKYSYNGKNFVDKDGNIASFRQNSFESRVLSDLNKLYNSESKIIRGKLNDMMKSKHQHSIVRSTVSGGIGYNKALDTDHAGKYGEGSDTETGYNPFATKSVCADGGYISCATLAHELLGHGWNNDQGLHESDNHTTENGIKFEEVNAVNIQNKVLVEHHQLPRSLVGSPNDAKQIPVELINHYYTTKPK